MLKYIKVYNPALPESGPAMHLCAITVFVLRQLPNGSFRLADDKNQTLVVELAPSNLDTTSLEKLGSVYGFSSPLLLANPVESNSD